MQYPESKGMSVVVLVGSAAGGTSVFLAERDSGHERFHMYSTASSEFLSQLS